MRRLSSPIFVGRAAELAVLRDACLRATNGDSAAVVVAGEAGVGKTRLVTEFCSWARDQGVRVLIGSSVPAGGDGLPYGAVAEAFRLLTRELSRSDLDTLLGPARFELARVIPELAWEQTSRIDIVASEPGPAPTRLFELILGVLGRMGERRPTVLVLEDLHWADRSTRDLFGFLVRNLRAGRTVLVGTVRTDELHQQHPLLPFLAELERARRLERLEVERFSAEESRAHLKAILGHDPEPDLRTRVFERSEGNPLFTEELIALERSRRGLPATIRDTFLARVQVLAKETQSLLRVAAVVGRSVDEGLLRALAPLDEPGLTASLREAVAHHVLVPRTDERGEPYEFRHVLLQETLYAELLPHERRALHEAVAQALEQRLSKRAGAGPGQSVELAHHWYQAHRPREALRAAINAAHASEEVYAFSDSTLLWERALELWGEVGAPGLEEFDRAELAHQAARAAVRAGDERRAARLLRSALGALDASGEPMRAGVLYVELAHRLASIGDTDGSQRALDDASALIPADPDSPERARVLVLTAQLLVGASRIRRARDAAAEARAVAARSGARAEEGHALHWLAVATTFLGDPESGLEHAYERRRIADATGDVTAMVHSHHSVGFVLQAALRFDEAAAVYLEGAAVATRYGHRSLAARMTAEAAEALRRLGRWSEADLVTRDVLERPGAHSSLDLHLVRGLLLAGMGEFEEAERHADAGWAQLDGPVPLTDINAKYFCTRAEVALWRGRIEDAQRAVADGLARLSGSGDLRWIGQVGFLGLRAEADHAAAARRRGDAVTMAKARRRGQEILETVHDVAEHSAEQWSIFRAEAEAPVLLCQAELARLEGRSDPASWDAAASAWRQISQPYPAAYARYRQAEALLRAGGARREAAALLGTALREALALGARPLQGEIESLARRARIPVADLIQRPGAHDPDADPFAAYRLTQRERDVLGLLARGASDREIAESLFISDKTASVHVLNIKSKLGVETRLEAARLAADLDPGLSPRVSAPRRDQLVRASRGVS